MGLCLLLVLTTGTSSHCSFFYSLSSIPSEIGQASSLSVLSMESNHLSKTVPTEVGLLTHLHWLMLYDNSLIGEVPSEIGMLGNLTWLRLEKNNNLIGTLPVQLGALENLEHITVHGTSMSGSVPSGFCDKIATDQLLVGVECEEISCDCGCKCFNSFLP